MGFQENLRKYFKEKGLSQKKAAELLGYSTVNLNHYLGDRDPNYDLIKALLAYDPQIDLNSLFKGTQINTGVNLVTEPVSVEYMTENERLINELEKNLQQLKVNLTRK